MPEEIEIAVIARLRAAGCVYAEDEAAMLLQAAPDEASLHEMVDRRAKGEPLEQVVGYADFCGIRVKLLPGVFVPRVRSELLVKLATAAVKALERPAVVVDLCCGSGALGLAVRDKAHNLDLYAADLDPAAVNCAKVNVGQERVFAGDLFTPLPAHLKGRIDVLLANVPYVATRHIPLLPAEARDHEPHTALDGGDDGLDVLRAVTAQAAEWLAPGATMFSEITEAQADAATAAVRQAGLKPALTTDEDLEATVVAGMKRFRTGLWNGTGY